MEELNTLELLKLPVELVGSKLLRDGLPMKKTLDSLHDMGRLPVLLNYLEGESEGYHVSYYGGSDETKIKLATELATFPELKEFPLLLKRLKTLLFISTDMKAYQEFIGLHPLTEEEREIFVQPVEAKILVKHTIPDTFSPYNIERQWDRWRENEEEYWRNRASDWRSQGTMEIPVRTSLHEYYVEKAFRHVEDCMDFRLLYQEMVAACLPEFLAYSEMDSLLGVDPGPMSIQLESLDDEQVVFEVSRNFIQRKYAAIWAFGSDFESIDAKTEGWESAVFEYDELRRDSWSAYEDDNYGDLEERIGSITFEQKAGRFIRALDRVLDKLWELPEQEVLRQSDKLLFTDLYTPPAEPEGSYFPSPNQLEFQF